MEVGKVTGSENMIKVSKPELCWDTWQFGDHNCQIIKGELSLHSAGVSQWRSGPYLTQLALATNYRVAKSMKTVSPVKFSAIRYTVEPPIVMDTLKSGQPSYNGQTVCSLLIHCPYISTSEEETTSKQWTKCSVHYSEWPQLRKISPVTISRHTVV